MFIHTTVGMNRLASKHTSPYLFHFNQEKKKKRKFNPAIHVEVPYLWDLLHVLIIYIQSSIVLIIYISKRTKLVVFEVKPIA